MAPPTIITTTHNADGLSVLRENPAFKTFGKAVTILYSTQDAKPINFANDADLAAFEARDFSALTPAEGAVVLIAEWPPNGEKELHRNMCLDLGVMLSGEVELILDGGETKILKPGDVMIHRATMHGWKNHSSTEPARMLFFLLPAEGVPANS